MVNEIEAWMLPNMATLHERGLIFRVLFIATAQRVTCDPGRCRAELHADAVMSHMVPEGWV